jgi:ribosomal protein S18 acetylase RimI-like enzyme
VSRTLVVPTIRPLRSSDRPLIEAMTRACRVFREDEVTVALDVVDAALGWGRHRDPDYETAGVELDGALAGWACWGPVPCTVGSFDLYWIVVAPERQGCGVGRALLEEVERCVAGRARLLVVETAGREEYAGTRAFYVSRGYQVAARIVDYYAPGDDLVTFVKRIGDPDSRIR